jgi:hypothetical protein
MWGTAALLLSVALAAPAQPGEAVVRMTGGPPLPDPAELGMAEVGLSDSSLAALQDTVLAWYLRRGYPFAGLGCLLSAPDTLRVRAVPGRRARLEEVRLEGLEKNRPELFLRLLELREGEVYDPGEVERWLERLQRSELIRSVGSTRLALGPGGDLVLVQAVTEAPTGHFAADLGYTGSGDAEDLEGGVEMLTRSLLGTGRELEITARRVDWGGVDAYLRYREPWIAGTPFSAEIRLAQSVPESSWVNREGELLLIWRVGDLDVSAGAGQWRGYPPNEPRQRYSYGLVGLSARPGRRVAQGWQGLVLDMEADMGSATRSDTTGEETYASAEITARGDVYLGWLGLGGRALAGGVLEGEWLSGRLRRMGGADDLRGYAEGSFRAGRYAVAGPEVSLGETETRFFVFSDLGAVETAGGWRWPASLGLGFRGRSGVFRVEAALGFPAREGPERGRVYLQAVAEVL